MIAATVNLDGTRRALSSAQTNVWLLQSLHPQATCYNLAVCYLIPLELDADRFKAAADWVFSHYHALYARLVANSTATSATITSRKKSTRLSIRQIFTGWRPQRP
jgi:hypothetical protein